MKPKKWLWKHSEVVHTALLGKGVHAMEFGLSAAGILVVLPSPLLGRDFNPLYPLPMPMYMKMLRTPDAAVLYKALNMAYECFIHEKTFKESRQTLTC